MLINTDVSVSLKPPQLVDVVVVAVGYLDVRTAFGAGSGQTLAGHVIDELSAFGMFPNLFALFLFDCSLAAIASHLNFDAFNHFDGVRVEVGGRARLLPSEFARIGQSEHLIGPRVGRSVRCAHIES